jgi:hypothetical protein
MGRKFTDGKMEKRQVGCGYREVQLGDEAGNWKEIQNVMIVPRLPRRKNIYR